MERLQHIYSCNSFHIHFALGYDTTEVFVQFFYDFFKQKNTNINIRDTHNNAKMYQMGFFVCLFRFFCPSLPIFRNAGLDIVGDPGCFPGPGPRNFFQGLIFFNFCVL